MAKVIGVPATPSTTLAENRRGVLGALRAASELTRAEISEVTGLSSAAAARITNQLEAERLIARTSQAPSAGGRPAWRYRFTAENRFVAAIRVQANGCHGVLLDWSGAITARVDNPLSDRTSDAFLAATLACSRDLAAAGVARGRAPVAIGVAVPSVVDAQGRVGAGEEVPWVSLPLRDLLAQDAGCPVVVENDANALAFSELDAARPGGSLAALLLGYGLGAGVVSEGRLLRGAHRTAGEIGYLLTSRTALDGPGLPSGDLEHRIRRAAGVQDPSAPVRLWGFLASPDPADQARASEMLDLLALAVSSLVTVADPERVVIGDVPDASGPRVVRELGHRLAGRLLYPPAIALARRGPDAVVIGAGLLAAEGVDLQAL